MLPAPGSVHAVAGPALAVHTVRTGAPRHNSQESTNAFPAPCIDRASTCPVDARGRSNPGGSHHGVVQRTELANTACTEPFQLSKHACSACMSCSAHLRCRSRYVRVGKDCFFVGRGVSWLTRLSTGGVLPSRCGRMCWCVSTVCHALATSVRTRVLCNSTTLHDHQCHSWRSVLEFSHCIQA